MFSLQGYYITIHVTPEPQCSYVSFETNVSQVSKPYVLYYFLSLSGWPLASIAYHFLFCMIRVIGKEVFSAFLVFNFTANCLCIYHPTPLYSCDLTESSGRRVECLYSLSHTTPVAFSLSSIAFIFVSPPIYSLFHLHSTE